MTDLTTLIAKLEAATGPDRELDVAISCAIDGRVLEKRGNDRKEWLYLPGTNNWRQDPGSYGQFLSPRFTASIDTAVALAERVLPGWDWGAHSFGEDGAQGKVWKHGWHDDTAIYADHTSPSIALLIAILRAKQAEGKV
ncbi:MAG: hypothetical protein DI589_11200 [Shinella sp.]|nr:MAG: hypothetical protein DI589_11200 [Shinella sp.]